MAHNYKGSTTGTEGATLDARSTGTKSTRRRIPPSSTPGFIGEQYSQYGNDVFPAGHTNRNLEPSSNADAMALGMSHDIGGYGTGGVTHGAPSEDMTTNMSNTLSSPTPGSVGDQYSHYDDGVDLAGYANHDSYLLNNASARAFEMTGGSSGYVNDGNTFGARAIGNTNTMGSSLLASGHRSMDDRGIYDSADVYGTLYPNVNPNPSNGALPIDAGTAYGSNYNTSNRVAFGIPSTGSATTMSDTILESMFGHEGSHYLQHSDGFYPTGSQAVNPEFPSSTLPTDTGSALGSNSDATNDIAIGTAHDSNSNAAANDAALDAQTLGIPLTLSINLSPIKDADGSLRWPCPQCSKTFAQQRGLWHHAKSHSGESTLPALPAQKPGIPRTLRSTYASIETTDGGTRWTCSMCSKSFPERTYAVKHAKTHSGEIPLSVPSTGL